MGAVSSKSHEGFRRAAPVRSPVLALRRHTPSTTAHSPQNPSLRLSVAGKRRCAKKNLPRPQVFDRAHRLHPPVPLLAARQAPRKNLPSVPKEYFLRSSVKIFLPLSAREYFLSGACLPARHCQVLALPSGVARTECKHPAQAIPSAVRSKAVQGTKRILQTI